MKRTHLPLLIFLLPFFGLVSVAPVSSAQSLWMPRDHDHGILIEVFKPDFDEIDENFVSFATFIGAKLPASGGVAPVLEFSFARFGGVFPGLNGPSHISSFTIGDIYVGMEVGGQSAPLFGELGVRLPTAAEGEAAITGSVSDLTRSDAFFSEVISAHAAVNVRRVTPGGVAYRLRLGPVLVISEHGGLSPEAFALYSGQLGYERQTFRVGVALSARTLLSGDFGAFAERSDAQAEIHADFGSGKARPGLELKLPLGDLGDTVPIVVGVSLGFSY